MLTAFWSTMFEPFIHGFDWEQIANHNKLIYALFDWHGVLEFHDSVGSLQKEGFSFKV